MSAVSAGAEVLADGHIHAYGRLRGRALAGIGGDEGARIFCRSLEAELVSIAGRFRVSVASGDSSQAVDVLVEHVDDVRRRLVVGGRRYSVVTATHGPTTLVEVDGVAGTRAA